MPSFTSGYILEFWMKLDTMREECAPPTVDKYLFYSIPHTLYMKPGESILNYRCTADINIDSPLKSFSTNEWNVFILDVKLTPGLNTVLGIYVNYKFAIPDLYLANIDERIDIGLKGIGFCNGNCVVNGEIKSIIWGAAFYKKLRYWDQNTSIQVIQDFHNNL